MRTPPTQKPRRVRHPTGALAANRTDSTPRAPGKSPRSRLTHLEVRRGKILLLRIAVAHNMINRVGDELGALLTKITPGTRLPTSDPDSADLIISPQHADHDEPYHAAVREHFTVLFSSLCDDSLADALALARKESSRRTEGSN
jgi:hypothetical protein